MLHLLINIIGIIPLNTTNCLFIITNFDILQPMLQNDINSHTERSEVSQECQK